ncbi:uncharacterized protein LOC108666458 [Hyalella azteca]|uniref:Uncharacterized protein LOC108666458 n=1 Tax=Hyalella azteca TaxID=294128 RepID=A0A8B7N4P1_HYAAZ|nr:uncharacterized protein LOC108666458 [Hyalella azteca]
MANCMLSESSSSIVCSEHGQLFGERLQALYNSGQLVDVIVIAGRYQVSAHRTVLAAASPVLLAHLQHYSNAHFQQLQLDTITEGCTSEDLHALLDFIYCGKATIPQYRLSEFLRIAKQLQLVGVHEASILSSLNSNIRNGCNVIPQRTIPAQRPLHVRSLSDQPPLATAEFQSLITQFPMPVPMPMPSNFIPDPSSSIPPASQIPLDSEITTQEDFHINNNLLQDNSGQALHSSKYRQSLRDEPVKFGESIKVDHMNWRSLPCSLSTTTFSDLCTADPDLSMLILGDGRSLNPSLRPVFADSNDGLLSSQDASFPKDYSQSTLKLVPNSLCNAELGMPSCEMFSEQQQGLTPISCAVVASVCSSTGSIIHQPSDTFASHAQGDSLGHQPFSGVNGNTVACPIPLYGTEEVTGVQDTNMIHSTDGQPLHLYHHPQHEPQLTLPSNAIAVNAMQMESSSVLTSCASGGYEENLVYNTGNSIWPFLAGPATESSSESVQGQLTIQKQPHIWCMPDETSLPELRDYSHPSESPSWAGGGRLKVKSSIGGVSLQDLSSANVSEKSLLNLRQTPEDDLPQTSSALQVNSSTASDLTSNKSPSDGQVSKSSKKTNSKTSRGKLAVRTDIKNVNYDTPCNEDISLPKNRSPCPKISGKTASIRVVSGKELLDARHVRDDPPNPPVSAFSKVSVVPEQQLLETSHCGLAGPTITLQEMAYGEEGHPSLRGDDVVKIKLPKPPSQADQLDHLREATVSHFDTAQSTSNYLSISTLSSNALLETNETVQVNPDELMIDAGSMTADESEDILVVQENSNEYQLPNNTSLDSLDVQVIDQTDTYHVDEEESGDPPRNLQILFTSSHQPSLYPQPFSYCSALVDESLDEPSAETVSEITPIKDTAKTQWATLHKKQNLGKDSELDFLQESSNSMETNELKVKKCLFASRSQTPALEDDTIDVTDSSGCGMQYPVLVPVSPSIASVPPSPTRLSSSNAIEDVVFTSSLRPNEISVSASPCPVIHVDETELPTGQGIPKSQCDFGDSLHLKHSFTPEPRPDSEPICLSVETQMESAIDIVSTADEATILPPNTSGTWRESLGKSASWKLVPDSVGDSQSNAGDDFNSSDVQIEERNIIPEDLTTDSPATCRTIGENRNNISSEVTNEVFSELSPKYSTAEATDTNSLRIADAPSETVMSLPTSPQTHTVPHDDDVLKACQSSSHSSPELHAATNLRQKSQNYGLDQSTSLDSIPACSDSLSASSTSEMSNVIPFSEVGVSGSETCGSQDEVSARSDRKRSISVKSGATTAPTAVENRRKAKEPEVADIATSTPEWKCTKCPEIVHSQAELLQHAKQHFSEAWPHCCLCQKKLKNKSTLRIHVITHVVAAHASVAQAHKCPACGAVYSQRNNLVRHLAARHNLSPTGTALTAVYTCPHCPFTCLALHKYKAHKRSHDLEKAHKCPHCPYKSAVKNALVKHIRIHTKERPYVCDICDFDAVTASILSRHKRSHSGVKPHSCSICHRQFADSKRLRDHLLMHDNVKPFMCHVCGFACRRKDNLQSHIRNLHDNDKTSAKKANKNTRLLTTGSPKRKRARNKNVSDSNDVSIFY